MEFTGKTREEIVSALAKVPRSKLIDIIVSMATLEQWFKPSDLAAARRMNVRDVRAAMKSGKLGGGYYRRAANSMFVSASGIAAWDRSFFIATHKKESAAEIGLRGKKNGAKGGAVRDGVRAIRNGRSRAVRDVLSDV